MFHGYNQHYVKPCLNINLALIEKIAVNNFARTNRYDVSLSAADNPKFTYQYLANAAIFFLKQYF